MDAAHQFCTTIVFKARCVIYLYEHTSFISTGDSREVICAESLLRNVSHLFFDGVQGQQVVAFMLHTTFEHKLIFHYTYICIHM